MINPLWIIGGNWWLKLWNELKHMEKFKTSLFGKNRNNSKKWFKEHQNINKVTAYENNYRPSICLMVKIVVEIHILMMIWDVYFQFGNNKYIPTKC